MLRTLFKRSIGCVILSGGILACSQPKAMALEDTSTQPDTVTDSPTRPYEVPDTVPFRKGDRWGFVNQAGDTVIQFEYGFTTPFVEDRASVFDRNVCFGTYLDREGKPITPFIYDKVVLFQHGLGRVKAAGKWGVFLRGVF
ncbi:WG repeat-containing protein [Roseivirga sp. BDSF3-8]|uniref:WG repeat-containing protein n=1 Tax=Roseivirga sp. BDSF3-8 TaxID=3241598 RepID=UPI0035320A03